MKTTFGLIRIEFIRKSNDIFVLIRNFVFFVILTILPLLCDQSTLYTSKNIWVNIVIITFFTFENFLQRERQSGLLDLYRISTLPVESVLFAKAFGEWSKFILPMALLSAAFAALSLEIDVRLYLETFYALAITTYSFAFISATLNTLLLDVERKNIVLSVLSFPLYVPLIIFGVSITNNLMVYSDCRAEHLVLLGYACLVTFLGPKLSKLSLGELQ